MHKNPAIGDAKVQADQRLAWVVHADVRCRDKSSPIERASLTAFKFNSDSRSAARAVKLVRRIALSVKDPNLATRLAHDYFLKENFLSCVPCKPRLTRSQ